MVFTTTNLFKGITCPEDGKCALTNCIYSHTVAQNASSAVSALAPAAQRSEAAAETGPEPTPKRRKTANDRMDPKFAGESRSQASAPLSGQRSRATPVGPASTDSRPMSSCNGNFYASGPPAELRSLAASVSPPPTSLRSLSSTGGADNNSKHAANRDAFEQNSVPMAEALNPRLIPLDPAGHTNRFLFLKYLHAEMVSLQAKVMESEELSRQSILHLTEQQLIKLALDDEEKFARENSSVYANVIKQRIALLRKMTPGAWVAFVTVKLETEKPKQRSKNDQNAKIIDTGLTLDEEILILPHLVADQKSLAAFGYIPIPPTAEQAAEAAAAVEASHNYEICDRCAARFQVFPDRNEDGLITSHGPCVHHPNRKAYHVKSKADKDTGPKEAYYPCCGETVGTTGCTRNEEHVFKTTSPARLAAVLPFATTPDNLSPAKDRQGREVKALSFDCEMGYTALGMEIIRLTAVSWPSGEELLDILVRPLGAVIDLNSRFSGIFPEHFKAAIPYDEYQISPPNPTTETAPPQTKILPMVASPQAARTLLCTFLTPETPVLGHSIDNDLNVIRLCHRTIIDTVLLFRHPRGLPMRFGLKMLTQKHLGRFIQTGGAQGHDSREDAIATGELVRVKVGEVWRNLSAKGWRVGEGELVPPAPVLGGKTVAREQVLETPERRTDNCKPGRKAKRKLGDDGCGLGSEEAAGGGRLGDDEGAN